MDLHVLIVEEDGVFNATCLEMGLAAADPDLEQTKRDMVEVIEGQIAACLEIGDPEGIFVAAPPEDWLEWASIEAEGLGHPEEFPAVTVEPGKRIPSLRISAMCTGAACVARAA